MINATNSTKSISSSSPHLEETALTSLESRVAKLESTINQLNTEISWLKQPTDLALYVLSDEYLYSLYSDIKNQIKTALKVKLASINTFNIKQFYEDKIAYLDGLQEYLDDVLPPSNIQRLLDGFYEDNINPLLNSTKLEPLMAWIDSNDYGTWYEKLGSYLTKLPLRAVRNNLLFIHHLLKAVVKAPVHPFDSAIDLAKFFITSIYALTFPKTLTQLGSGTIGAGLGQLLIMSSAPYLSIGFGGVIFLSSLALAVAKAAAKKEITLERLKEKLWKQITFVPESFMTGLVGGLMKGGVQKLTETRTYIKLTTKKQAEEYLDSEFLKKYHLPPPKMTLTSRNLISVDPATGNIRVYWTGAGANEILKSNPSFIPFWPKKWPSQFLQRGMNMDIIHPSLIGSGSGNISTWFPSDPKNIFYINKIDYPSVTTSLKLPLLAIETVKSQPE